MSNGLAIFIIFIGTLLMGLPVAACLGVTAVIGFILGGLPLDYIAQTAFTAVDDFTTIAVPMFILAGAIMEKGGLTGKLIDFAKAIVGRRTGGLALVTIIACTLFGAISGSGVATTAAIGSMMIPSMIREGYHKDFAGAVTACAGGIGAVIPPSILMIIYGVSAEVSITALFVGGIIPGLMLGLFLMVAALIVSSKRGYRSGNESLSVKAILSAAWQAKFALLAPVIILGGIYGGIVTVTEASVVAVVYSFIIVTFVDKRLSRSVFFDCLVDTARVSGTLILIISTGRMFGRLLTIYQIPQVTSQFLITHVSNPILLVLLIDFFLLFIGMWMESATQIIILTPLLLPVVTKLGIDPVQFGIMFVVACEIGFETPPLGINLFVASEIAGTSIERISKEAIPFIIAESTALIIISLIPQISLVVPRLMGLM
ncbi:MAG: TRAP transporter large permease [Treponemataceae bacterium]